MHTKQDRPQGIEQLFPLIGGDSYFDYRFGSSQRKNPQTVYSGSLLTSILSYLHQGLNLN